jgi:hypothetical protein
MKYKLSKNIFPKNIFIIIFFIVILLILYLYYKKYYSNKEHYSNGILDLLQYKGEPIKYNIDKNYDKNKDNKSENEEEEEEEKIIYKHIFLKNNSKNNTIVFDFYNKKMENYLIIKGKDKNNIKIKDVDNKNIGNIKHFKYNTFTTNYDDYNVDYTLLYNDKRLIKIMYENDIYYISRNISKDVKKKKYIISLFELNIGSIEKINNNTYKINIEEKYKIVLNNIGFGLIIDLLRNKL